MLMKTVFVTLAAVSIQATAPCPVQYSYTDHYLFGVSVSGGGDVNNDGYSDFIIGSPSYYYTSGHVDTGKVYVLSGSNGDTLFVFSGEQNFDYFGGSVSGAGDVNGDGYADIIVGARKYTVNAVTRGKVYVYSGQNGNLLYQFTGASDATIGIAVAGVGDINNDGFDDFAFSSPYWNNRTGMVYVFSGQTGLLLYTLNGNATQSNFGFSLSEAGDVNKDGYSDLIVGAEIRAGNTGAAYVYSGAMGTVIYSYGGPGINSYYGKSVSDAGDVNNDSWPDFIVGASNQAYIYSGQNGSLLYTFNGSGSEGFGRSVAGAGDIDGDNFDDLIVGAPDFSSYDGRVYLFSGATGTILYSTGIWNGEGRLGWSVDGIGDINHDGFDDIIVGSSAYWSGSSVPGSGAVVVYTLSPDTDGDGILDLCDNCPSQLNSTQDDSDGDGMGDACDSCPFDPDNDSDNDGICGDVDNCPAISNPLQEDTDGDGFGNACDNCPADAQNDADSDGICGNVDNCPSDYNPGQEDADGDGIGDACDNCPADSQNDADGDGICGDVDNCPFDYNPGQEDADGDSIGNLCDPCQYDPLNDIDADGVCGDTDNCPGISNPLQEDSDNDGMGDSCDVCPTDSTNDIDGDGVCGKVDNCPTIYNPGQEDSNNDGVGDACSFGDSLVAYWRFDEDSGLTVYDYSGNSNTGTLYNGPIRTPGIAGQGLQFDGVDDYMYVSSSSSLEMTTAMTVMAWVKVQQTTGDHQVICAKWFNDGGGFVGSFVLEFQPDGITPQFTVARSGDRHRPTAVSSVTVPAGIWAHLAGTYDGAQTKIYVNGVFAGSVPLVGTINVGTHPVCVGAHTSPSDRNWLHGVVDEMKVYDIALSENEVYEEYLKPGAECGDVDNSGAIDVADLTYVVNYMFKAGPFPIPRCSVDLNGDGQLGDISDLTYFVAYLFQGGSVPTSNCCLGRLQQ